MLKFVKIKYLQFLEHCQQKGIGSAIKFVFYKEEDAVPVVKDLEDLKNLKNPSGFDGLKLVEIRPDNFNDINIKYPAPSRKERAGRYFKKGYRSLALVKDGGVIGDLWYLTGSETINKGTHPHLKWFGINLKKDAVYMFDMYFTPDERGKALSTFFMNSVLHKMKDDGFKKAYGYFALHNIPALWVHRLVGFKEMPRVAIRRYFLYETCRSKG